MSVRRPAVALKRAAQGDVRSILLHAGERWGLEQRDAYRAKLDGAFSILRSNPRVGRSRDDIAAGLRSYQIEEHVIYYRVVANAVTIVRILHGKMDASRHLAES